jgi:hypothetical protein
MTTRVYQRIGLSIVLVALFWYLRVTVFKPGPTTAEQSIEHANAANPNAIQIVAPPRGRHLSEQQISALGVRLRAFRAQKFWIIPETGEYAPQAEEWIFGQELQQALLAAGWIASQKVRQRMGRSGFKETMMYTYSHGGDRGLLVFAAPDSMPAGTALNSAISEMSFRSSVERDDNLRNAILIFVGAR